MTTIGHSQSDRRKATVSRAARISGTTDILMSTRPELWTLHSRRSELGRGATDMLRPPRSLLAALPRRTNFEKCPVLSTFWSSKMSLFQR